MYSRKSIKLYVLPQGNIERKRFVADPIAVQVYMRLVINPKVYRMGASNATRTRYEHVNDGDAILIEHV